MTDPQSPGAGADPAHGDDRHRDTDRHNPVDDVDPAGPVDNVDHHGNSVAAWTAVAIILLGALVMAVAVVLTSLPVFLAGVAVVVVGAVTGKVLSRAGYGAQGRSRR
jgi:hypothetical protein